MFVKSYMLLNEKKIHCKKKVVNVKMSFPIRCSFLWGLLLDVANQNIIPFTGILGGVYFVYSLRPFLSHSFISLSQAFHFLFSSCSFSHHSGVVYAASHHFFSPVSARECVASTQLQDSMLWQQYSSTASTFQGQGWQRIYCMLFLSLAAL